MRCGPAGGPRSTGRRRADRQPCRRLPPLPAVEKLYQSPVRETVEVPVELAGLIEAAADKDILSGREELPEKALAAYIEQRGRDGLPKDWQTILASARNEVEGRSSGDYEPDFLKQVADAGRREQDPQRGREADARRRERDGNDRGR